MKICLFNRRTTKQKFPWLDDYHKGQSHSAHRNDIAAKVQLVAQNIATLKATAPSDIYSCNQARFLHVNFSLPDNYPVRDLLIYVFASVITSVTRDNQFAYNNVIMVQHMHEHKLLF